MHRCLIPPTEWHGAHVALPAEARHYLCDVLRLEHGAELQLFDGTGREALVRLVADGASPFAEVLREIAVAGPAMELVLYQAIPKQRRMELIMEKGTELGMSCIHPVVTDRTIVRIDGKQAASRCERWLRICEGAARQCGRSSVPEVRPVAQSLEQALSDGSRPELLLVGVIRPDTTLLGDLLDRFGTTPPASVGMIIGPEGDLTPREEEVALAAGAQPVYFGPQVLRVETAALFSLSVLAHRLAWS